MATFEKRATTILDEKVNVELTYRELLYIRLNMGTAGANELEQRFKSTEVEYDSDFDAGLMSEIGCELYDMGVRY